MNQLRLLILQRLAELGEKGSPMSGREAARRSGGRVSFGTIANIVNGRHSGRITDPIAEGLAAALDVPVDRIYEAAGAPRPQSRWSLPEQFDRVPVEMRQRFEGLVSDWLNAYTEGYEAAWREAHRTGRWG